MIDTGLNWGVGEGRGSRFWQEIKDDPTFWLEQLRGRGSISNGQKHWRRNQLGAGEFELPAFEKVASDGHVRYSRRTVKKAAGSADLEYTVISTSRIVNVTNQMQLPTQGSCGAGVLTLRRPPVHIFR